MRLRPHRTTSAHWPSHSSRFVSLPHHRSCILVRVSTCNVCEHVGGKLCLLFNERDSQRTEVYTTVQQ